MTEEFKNALTEAIADSTDDDGCYCLYWDYRDEIAPETIKKCLDSKEPYSALYDTLYELNMDYLDSSFLDAVKDNLSEAYRDELDEVEDLWDLLNQCGFNGYDLSLEEILSRSRFKVNLYLTTKAEREKRLESLTTVFGNSNETPNYDKIKKDSQLLDSSLAYLIHQQGYRVMPILRYLDGSENSQHLSKFEEAIIEEVQNNTATYDYMLVALASLDGNELITLKEAIDNGQSNIRISNVKDVTLCLFDPDTGSGGCAGIELVKDFIFPAAFISRLQIEGANKDETTVNRAYDLWGGCWTECLSIEDASDIDILKEKYYI